MLGIAVANIASIQGYKLLQVVDRLGNAGI